VLGTAIQRAEKARGLLQLIFYKINIAVPVKLPDISTKDKAQKYIGFDMQALRKDKEEFINKVLIEWDKKARARQGSLKKY
jgi:nitrite reductase (cytochrome c-552)